MRQGNGWTRGQLLAALKLYCEIPFGKMHSRNPEIIRIATMIGRTADALAMKLTNFASLDPRITATGRKGLQGASGADRAIWAELTANWQEMADEMERNASKLGLADNSSMPRQTDEAADYTGVTRTSLVETRVGQQFFRRAVLSAYDNKCCITGLAIPALLVASHIVPWSSDASKRLDPRNGLCLSALHDRAFDEGLIAVSENFEVMVSSRIKSAKASQYLKDAFLSYADKPIIMPAKFTPDPGCLQYHRENLFVA